MGLYVREKDRQWALLTDHFSINYSTGGVDKQHLEQEHWENMTWQWKVSQSLCVCVFVCVGVLVWGWEFVCQCSRGLHITQGTNFSNRLIAGANEVRQESAELVNSWRACQMGW